MAEYWILVSVLIFGKGNAIAAKLSSILPAPEVVITRDFRVNPEQANAPEAPNHSAVQTTLLMILLPIATGPAAAALARVTR